ncbi:MAG: hypothetical protein ACM3SR_12360 [Ignavibacteriales bacterium]
MNDEAYGIMANLGNPAQNTQTNFYAENNVSIGGKYTDFYLRSQTNAQLVNNTAINSHSSGFTADKQDKYPGSPSTFCTNCLAVSNAGTGFSWSGQGTWKIDYSNSYGNGTNYSPAMPNANITNSMSINPNLGACKVYIPAGSPMKGKGKNGADIGANIIYRYQGGENGTAVYLNTAQKLWNQSTGQFPCGATVNTSGLNTTDLNGATKSTEACINVNKRLNVGVNGCPIP